MAGFLRKLIIILRCLHSGDAEVRAKFSHKCGMNDSICSKWASSGSFCQDYESKLVFLMFINSTKPLSELLSAQTFLILCVLP